MKNFKNLLIPALLMTFYVTICASGIAGWYIIVSNGAQGDMAFAVWTLFFLLTISGAIGITYQCGFLAKGGNYAE